VQQYNISTNFRICLLSVRLVMSNDILFIEHQIMIFNKIIR